MAEIKTVTYTDSVKYPCKIEDLREYLGITHLNYDKIIDVIAAGAADLIEQITGEALVRKTYTVTFDFIGELVFTIPRFPYISISSVKGQSTDGTLTTLVEGTDYYLRGNSEKVIEFLEVYDNYQFTLAAGHATGLCPPMLVLAVMKQTAFDSENRSSGTITDEVYKSISPFIHYHA